MESSKRVKSDSSSDESTNHHHDQEQVKDGASNITKRSYECTYCKRGFTNAQALGGHMNIHRKDRAKAAKQNQQHHANNSSVSKPPHQDYFDPVSSELAKYYVGSEVPRNNYHMYLPPMDSSPNYYSQADYRENEFSAPRSEIYLEERAGANLSLRIGSDYMEDRDVMRVDDQEKDEVDLELRLGPDP